MILSDIHRMKPLLRLKLLLSADFDKTNSAPQEFPRRKSFRAARVSARQELPSSKSFRAARASEQQELPSSKSFRAARASEQQSH
jgi:hypothetical protein